MNYDERIFCFEVHGSNDPWVHAAEQLYEATQHPDERIPWGWIARSIKGRVTRRPGGSQSHLLVATPESDVENPGALAGFAYGVFLPGYGGYICYVGVSQDKRKRGVGFRLMDQMVKLFSADAGAADEPLPFVVWESRMPTLRAKAADRKLWQARVRLFDRCGGLWVDGIELQSPNVNAIDAPPIPLQLFLKPMERPAHKFTSRSLERVAKGLLTQVYHVQKGEPLYEATLPADRKRAKLRPALAAGRRLLSTS